MDIEKIITLDIATATSAFVTGVIATYVYLRQSRKAAERMEQLAHDERRFHLQAEVVQMVFKAHERLTSMMNALGKR